MKKEKKEKKDLDDKTTQGPIKNIGLFWILVLFLGISYMSIKPKGLNSQLPYNEFKGLIKSGEITKITIRGKNISGSFQQAITLDSGNKKGALKTFKTIIPDIEDPLLFTLLEQKNVELNVLDKEQSTLVMVLLNLLPWILILGFFYYSSKKLSKGLPGMGGKGMLPFDSTAKKFEKSETSMSYDDVAGLENAKKDLQDVVSYLKDPTIFSKIGAELPKGVLLMGSPGTGKTLLAKATAGEADVPFYSINGSEFIEVFVGVGASRVRELFKNAKKNAPSIIFIDEIDSIGRARGTGLGGGHDEREQTLNQILSEMDGFGTKEPVIVIAATNRPDVLDPALIRPGRFDRQVTLDLPHLEAREAILKIHLKKVSHDPGLETLKIAKGIIGFSGADIKNLVNEAALLAARQGKDLVTANYFDLARDKIIMGDKRENKLSDEDKRVVAYHEAGHAVVAYFTESADTLKKITIIPRGRALGFTEQQADKENFNPTKTYLIAQLAILLGGRISEEIIFNEVTVGAEDDLKRSTKLARKMVANFGMSKKIGLLSFQQGEEHRFLGKEINQDKDFSEKTAQLIDEEVKSLIEKRREYVTELLIDKKELLINLAETLIKDETLEFEKIKSILEKNS